MGVRNKKWNGTKNIMDESCTDHKPRALMYMSSKLGHQ